MDTTLDLSSAVESSMDDGGSDGHDHRHLQTLTKANSFATAAITAANKNGRFGAFRDLRSDGFGEQEDDEDTENFPEECDAEVWGAFAVKFRHVQSILDQNRALIQQVNENHQSKIHDNLVKNVALIQEINPNIWKVVSLYVDLSVNFSSMFHQGNDAIDANRNNGKGDSAQA
ncbi:hypothetical protein U1Q18_022341 [Sarracenia purpurea var. burkii]